MRKVARQRGYEIAEGSLSIDYDAGQPEWHYVAIASDRKKGSSVSELAQMMSSYEGVDRFGLRAHCRH